MTEPKFEEAMARLEKIVLSLEKGELELEKALGLFQEGLELIKVCDSQLKEAEQKLEQLNSEGAEDQ